ncbi:MAG: peptidoglycan DD-metalloendopeptidase family protein [Elusimicrobia bacterium]|nr:peptidoglycan DD-metalloendopeptidase family protein [Elusimicrobiota bacterium]
MKRTALKIVIVVSSLYLVYSIGNKLGCYLFPVKNGVKVMVAEGEIKKGESLYATLDGMFPVNEVLALGRELSTVCNIQKVNPGDKYKVYYSSSSKILKFIYMPSPMINYVVDRSSEGFIVSKLVPEIEEKTVAVKGAIRSSLYEGMQRAGVSVHTIMEFADIFQWQIDFFTDVRPEDKFLLVYTQYYVAGEKVDDGQILVAGYKGKSINYTAIGFRDGESYSYYDAEGNSLRKQFLKAPLSYKRISSYFSYRRMHPILKYVRSHLGIDYAAPVGTPVSSIGAGKVTGAGWKGGFGRTVTVRHNSIYTTQYGHLSRYARGIKKGVYVKQGQVIGYVGTSGLSTGPHLDFRINRYGRPVNFLKLELPPAESIANKSRKSFDNTVEKARFYLKCLESDYFYESVRSVKDYAMSTAADDIRKKKLQK